MSEILFPAASQLILTQPNNPRAATVEMLGRLAVGKCNPERVAPAPSTRDAIRIAKQVTPPEGLICFTGSLYLIGEVQALIPQFRRATVAK
jgi:dihydrofolate synthase / folylpolyglutamate synthase